MKQSSIEEEKMVDQIIDYVKNRNLDELKNLVSELDNQELNYLFNQKNEEGKSALSVALTEYDPNIILYLLEELRVSFNNLKKDEFKDFETPLYHYKNDYINKSPIIRYLIEKDECRFIDINEKDSQTGKTLLHCAAEKGDYAMIECLLRKNQADVNKVDNDGNTALHYAINNGYENKKNSGFIREEHKFNKEHLEITKLLVKHGANPNIKNNVNDNAFSKITDKKYLKQLNDYLSDKNQEIFKNTISGHYQTEKSSAKENNEKNSEICNQQPIAATFRPSTQQATNQNSTQQATQNSTQQATPIVRSNETSTLQPNNPSCRIS